jgi:hypothetical protein
MPKNVMAFLIPKIGQVENYSGETIYVTCESSGDSDLESFHGSLPVSGTLVRRIVLKGDTFWYVFIPNSPIYAMDVVDRMFLVKLKKKGAMLNRTNTVDLQMVGLNQVQDFADGVVSDGAAVPLPFVQGRIIDS